MYSTYLFLEVATTTVVERGYYDSTNPTLFPMIPLDRKEDACREVYSTENDSYVETLFLYGDMEPCKQLAYMSENSIEEDGRDDIYMSYFFVDDEENYQYYKNDYHYGIYDEDFEIKFNDKKRYIFSYGRKLKWLEYNPEMVSQFGGFANRAGADWSIEREEGIIYLYEIDFNGPGHLADMSLDF